MAITQNGALQRDDNGYPVMGGTSSLDDSTVVNSAIDPITRRLLTDAASVSGVTTVSVVTANGFAGNVANPTSTPAITMSTTVTGVLKGNGTAISAAVANTDYQSPIALTTTGTSGAATFNGTTLNIPQYQAAGTYVTSVSGTSNRITSSGGTTPAIDIAATYVGQTSITTLGTIATGTWNGGVIGPAYGGTGVANNAAMTVTGSGNFAYTRTLTGATNVTFPTTGTLATLAGSETLTNKSISLANNTLTATSAQLAAAISDETGTGVAVFNVKPTFVGTIQTVTAMGAQALDGSTANIFTRTLASSETFTQSNFSAGQCFMVEVTQGSGTSYTVTWFSGITWVTSGGTAPTQTTVSNGKTTYGFRCTGTNTFLGYLIGTN